MSDNKTLRKVDTQQPSNEQEVIERLTADYAEQYDAFIANIKLPFKTEAEVCQLFPKSLKKEIIYDALIQSEVERFRLLDIQGEAKDLTVNNLVSLNRRCANILGEYRAYRKVSSRVLFILLILAGASIIANIILAII